MKDPLLGLSVLLQRYLPAVIHAEHVFLQLLPCICKFDHFIFFPNAVNVITTVQCVTLWRILNCMLLLQNVLSFNDGIQPTLSAALLINHVWQVDPIFTGWMIFFPPPSLSFSMGHPISRRHLEANVTAPDGQMSHVLLSSCLHWLC